jgi:ABC transport system ATP-binding/permease protein
VLLDHVTWQLGPGDRIGVLGPNGAGKTSLLRVLAGEGIGREDGSADSAAETPIRPSRAPRPAGSGVTGEDSVRGEPRPGQAARAGVVVTGRVVRGKTVRLGYLAQDDAPVDPGLSAREVVTQVRGNLAASEGAGSAGQLLERLGLRGDTQFTPAGELSGGERRRVQVLALLVDEPNVLLLDEPTNDLDVDTLTELEDLLDGWPGSLLVVSHDRYFLERVTDHVVALLGDGKLSYLGGGVEEYLARRAAPPAAQPEARPAGRAGGRPAGDGAGPGAAGAEHAARKELQRLERQIDRLTTREAELSAELAAQASDYQKLIDLGAQLRSVQQDKARLEEQWLTVAAELPG